MPGYAAAPTNQSALTRLPGLVTVQIVSVLMICLSIALLGPNFVAIMAPPEYHEARSLIPWFVLGYAFLGLYSVPMNGLSLGMGRTKFVWIATVAAACTNIALINLLVPSHGILAAAIASAIGYFVLLVAIGWYSWNPLNPVQYEWSKLLRAVGVVVATYSAAILTTNDTGLINTFGRVGWIMVAAAGLVITGSVLTGGVRVLLARLRLA